MYNVYDSTGILIKGGLLLWSQAQEFCNSPRRKGQKLVIKQVASYNDTLDLTGDLLASTMERASRVAQSIRENVKASFFLSERYKRDMKFLEKELSQVNKLIEDLHILINIK